MKYQKILLQKMSISVKMLLGVGEDVSFMQIESRIPPRPPARRSFMKMIVIALTISLIITGAIVSLVFFMQEEAIIEPNDEQVKPYPEPVVVEDQGILYPLIYNGQLMSHQVMVEDGEFYLPFELVKAEIDPYLFYDQAGQTVILTTSDQVITLNSTHLTKELKNETVDLLFPVKEIEGTIYVPYSPFETIYPYELNLFFIGKDEGVVELRSFDQPRLYGEIHLPVTIEEQEKQVEQEEQEPRSSYVRTGYTDQAPFVQKLMERAEVIIYEEKEDWYYIQTNEGYIGYVPKEEVHLKGIVTQKWEKPGQTFSPWNPLGEKINLTWEHIVRRTPDTDSITPPQGINVVSPTWFHLQDDQGTLKNIADKRYVDWAHKNGYQVWALVTNDFNPDFTHEVLSDYSKRKNLILQLLYFSELYNLDGINIDFENVYTKDKENLVQFMRELTPYLHEQGLVVSIDVTIRSQSEMWSVFLDRVALGEVVDYMMVMTYDEHWATSPKAGSVASLPWVERGLLGVLEQVPNEKLLLGVPFYTRLWKEEKDDQGKIKVSSKAYSMKGIEEWIAERNVPVLYDELSGQNYAEYHDKDEDVIYKIWLENEISMAKRIELVHKYDLAGVASWRRGFEKPAIWEVIQEGLKKRLH
jgi:spore germination protein YaaH